MNVTVNFNSILTRGFCLTEQEKSCLYKNYKQLGREKIYQFAQKKKILPFVANTFAQCGLDVAYWQEILCQYRERNQAILGCLNEVYAELERQGVKKMFVSENYGALLSSGNDIALFASGDVDNYADPAEKERIYQSFEVLGYTQKARYSGYHQIAAEFFPPKTAGLPENFYIRVDFYPLARLKLPCFVNADDFVDWDGLYCYGDTSVKLPPANALMYICLLHISLHSFSRAPDIRLYIDLMNASRLSIDYGKIAVWCCRDGTCTRVAVAAYVANLLTLTSLPEILTDISQRRDKVVALVYDISKNDLQYEPRGLKVMLIESLCHDKGIVHGLWEMLFPDSAWMKKTYGSSGIAAHMKHFFRML